MTDEAKEIRLRQETLDCLNELLAVIIDVDSGKSPRFQPDTNGVRLALAWADDYVHHALASWDVYKLTGNWFPARMEMMMAAATLVRMAREIKSG